jgi:hypothetical protein
MGRRHFLATNYTVDLYRVTETRTQADGGRYSSTTDLEYQGRPTKLSSSNGLELLLGPTADSVHLSMAMARERDTTAAQGEAEPQTPDPGADTTRYRVTLGGSLTPQQADQAERELVRGGYVVEQRATPTGRDVLVGPTFHTFKDAEEFQDRLRAYGYLFATAVEDVAGQGDAQP